MSEKCLVSGKGRRDSTKKQKKTAIYNNRNERNTHYIIYIYYIHLQWLLIEQCSVVENNWHILLGHLPQMKQVFDTVGKSDQIFSGYKRIKTSYMHSQLLKTGPRVSALSAVLYLIIFHQQISSCRWTIHLWPVGPTLEAKTSWSCIGTAITNLDFGALLTMSEQFHFKHWKYLRFNVF